MERKILCFPDAPVGFVLVGKVCVLSTQTGKLGENLWDDTWYGNFVGELELAQQGGWQILLRESLLFMELLGI